MAGGAAIVGYAGYLTYQDVVGPEIGLGIAFAKRASLSYEDDMGGFGRRFVSTNLGDPNKPNGPNVKKLAAVCGATLLLTGGEAADQLFGSGSSSRNRPPGPSPSPSPSPGPSPGPSPTARPYGPYAP